MCCSLCGRPSLSAASERAEGQPVALSVIVVHVGRTEDDATASGAAAAPATAAAAATATTTAEPAAAATDAEPTAADDDAATATAANEGKCAAREDVVRAFCKVLCSEFHRHERALSAYHKWYSMPHLFKGCGSTT